MLWRVMERWLLANCGESFTYGDKAVEQVQACLAEDGPR